MQLHKVFAVPIGESRYEDTDDNENVRLAVLRMFEDATRPKGADRGRTQQRRPWYKQVVWMSPPNLQEDAVFGKLFQFIENSVRQYLDAHEYIYDGISITGAWANVFEQRQLLDYHYHPNSFISGVYYVSAQDCPICFADIKPHWILPANRKQNDINSTGFDFMPADRTLVLFPSYVYHRTNPNLSRTGEQRVSIAFDVVLTGTIGEVRKEAVGG
jgi:uncharacterized protein (TIGR02466 family)